MLDDLQTYAFATAGGSAVTTYVTDGKVAILLPILIGLLGFVVRVLRNQVSLHMSLGQISDPILLDQKTVVSQPDPIEPKNST